LSGLTDRVTAISSVATVLSSSRMVSKVCRVVGRVKEDTCCACTTPDGIGEKQCNQMCSLFEAT